jgi:hypothetical protein
MQGKRKTTGIERGEKRGLAATINRAVAWLGFLLREEK